MTEFLYAQYEGALWEMFKSPLEVSDIESILAFATVNYQQGSDTPPTVRETDGYFYFIPGDDQLPKFHSILTHDGRRWDALNRLWEGPRYKHETRAAFEAVLKRAGVI